MCVCTLGSIVVGSQWTQVWDCSWILYFLPLWCTPCMPRRWPGPDVPCTQEIFQPGSDIAQWVCKLCGSYWSQWLPALSSSFLTGWLQPCSTMTVVCVLHLIWRKFAKTLIQPTVQQTGFTNTMFAHGKRKPSPALIHTPPFNAAIINISWWPCVIVELRVHPIYKERWKGLFHSGMQGQVFLPREILQFERVHHGTGSHKLWDGLGMLWLEC